MTSPTRLLEQSLGSLLTGDNRAFLEGLRERFERDPATVDPSWHLALALLSESREPALHAGQDAEALVARLRTRGHTVASLDPISQPPSEERALLAARDLLGPAADGEAIARLAPVYCGSLGIETEHLDEERLRAWVYQAAECYAMEAADWPLFARTIVEATEFERLMGVKFTAKKRFGGEGAEAVVLLLRRVLWRLAGQGVGTAVIGTMHRGRLNLQANAMGRPLVPMLAEFAGQHPFGDGSAADVPYHLGWQGPLTFPDGRRIGIDLLPNPSHLEAVNTIAIGKARGLQDAAQAPGSVVAIVLHTDASVVAQGSVAEMLQLSGLEGFSTGGTIHIVINNQIGFTTNPDEARTSRYCTGPWKAIDSLIVHANGDDIGAVVKAADLAVDYRSAHRRDSVVDLVCYRRNGHNEIDEPRFTQPVLYDRIEHHPPVAETLVARLAASGIVPATAADAWRAAYDERFQPAYEEAKRAAKGTDGPADHVATANGREAVRPDQPRTGLETRQLSRLIEQLAAPPPGLTIDPKLERIVRRRADEARDGIPWPLAEALAFASLDAEGVPSRLTGQDIARGAFSHRHYLLTDTRSGERVQQIGARGSNRRNFQVWNSPLSEYAVLGFEYGYSLARPDTLVIWEAQFGDFANGAQIVIDQFVASGREKWGLHSGLVLLLPHGLEGQGPEHSSARIERFLQLCQPDNFDVALPSTPANYFHILRLQALRTERRPLVILGAKAMLRHPAAVSPLADLTDGSAFRPVIASRGVNGAAAERVVLCSGKIAYDLEREVLARGLDRTLIVRIERLHPFPHAELAAQARRSPGAHFVYVQEEPRNMGAWDYLSARLARALADGGAKAASVDCVSRPASGSPAGSFHGWHDRDQSELVARALYGPAADSSEVTMGGGAA